MYHAACEEEYRSLIYRTHSWRVKKHFWLKEIENRWKSNRNCGHMYMFSATLQCACTVFTFEKKIVSQRIMSKLKTLSPVQQDVQRASHEFVPVHSYQWCDCQNNKLNSRSTYYTSSTENWRISILWASIIEDGTWCIQQKNSTRSVTTK